MAPLSKAIDVEYVSSSDGVATYRGHVDADWSIGVVPHGGYVLALVVQACIQHQSTTSHPDLIHITAHYLSQTSFGSFTIHIRNLKTSRRFTHLKATLEQQTTKITTHGIFSSLPPPTSSTSTSSFTLAPPSPYARRLPLYLHPSTATTTDIPPQLNFHTQTKWAVDPVIQEKNSRPNTSRPNVGGDGLEWGAWFEFTGSDEKITIPSLAFLVDVFHNTPSLLPRGERSQLGRSRFPTMVLSIDFKFPIPSTLSKTVGIYSTGRFINEPQGKHDIYVEVWSSPTNIGEGEIKQGWQDEQVCLAISTQMALTLPMELDTRKADDHASHKL